MTHKFAILTLTLLLVVSVSAWADDGLKLLDAVKNQDSDHVRLLIDSGVNVNIREGDGSTALHWAARRNNMELTQLLLAADADPDIANDYGVTPLWLACINHDHELVEKLLQAGADPDAQRITGETVLMRCAQTGTVNAVDILLNYGADVNKSESRKGQTALMWAAAGGHSKVVRSLLEHGAKVSSRSNNNFTPLLFSGRSGDVKSAQLLLDAGADPNEATLTTGNSLVIASAGGHEELALFLLSKGADPNAMDENGITALHHAVQSGLAALNGVRYDAVYRVRPMNMHSLASALLEAGADPNAQIKQEQRLGPDGVPFSMRGATPFLLAAASADYGLMRMMEDYEADPQINAEGGITPLMAAARAACTGSCAFQGGNKAANENDIELSLKAVKAAVAMGVDVNAMNEDGRTAMHMAAFTGIDPVVQYLADNGANVNVQDKYGETPWSMASGISPGLRYRGLYGVHESTAALLIKLGAVPITLEEMDPKARHGQ
jgi:ankyrin repeat protein